MIYKYIFLTIASEIYSALTVEFEIPGQQGTSFIGQACASSFKNLNLWHRVLNIRKG